MRLRHRIARLLRQSRIRLPRSPLEAGELRPGDWIQLGARAFRVLSRRFELGQVVFQLRSVDGNEHALLEPPSKTPGSWTVHRHGDTISLPSETLIVFPVGSR